jgi:hypothetical protein
VQIAQFIFQAPPHACVLCTGFEQLSLKRLQALHQLTRWCSPQDQLIELLKPARLRHQRCHEIIRRKL